MTKPKIEFLPLRPAFCAESAQTVEFVARISVPSREAPAERPSLSLGLVIDRSGSMQGDKIRYARAAASVAVESLRADDRVSVTIFDDRVETVIPSRPASDRAAIMGAIAMIEPRGNTNLHAGWAAGAASVSEGQKTAELKRVIILTDGLANEGVTAPEAIAAAVRAASAGGVATSAMGIGADFNEDLLEKMAEAGDGNYWYIETPDQLSGIFEAELRGFMACVGRQTRLGIIPADGVELVEVLNDFPIAPNGAFILPNLVAGGSLDLGLSLRIDPREASNHVAPMELCALRLVWNDAESGERASFGAKLSLPVITQELAEAMPLDSAVRETLALLRSGRIKREMMAALDSGGGEDFGGKIASLLVKAKAMLSCLPQTPSVEREVASLVALGADLENRRFASLRKSAHYEQHSKGHGYDPEVVGKYYLKKFAMLVGDRISVVMGNIVVQDVDAIVNSCDSGVSGSFGLDAAIQKAGGPELRDACARLGGCPAGEARATAGFDLDARFVFHASVPTWKGGAEMEEARLATAYGACLALAAERGVKSIAFPALGCGGRKYPLSLAVATATAAVMSGLMSKSTIERAVFVCGDLATYEAFKDAINPN